MTWKCLDACLVIEQFAPFFFYPKKGRTLQNLAEVLENTRTRGNRHLISWRPNCKVYNNRRFISFFSQMHTDSHWQSNEWRFFLCVFACPRTVWFIFVYKFKWELNGTLKPMKWMCLLCRSYFGSSMWRKRRILFFYPCICVIVFVHTFSKRKNELMVYFLIHASIWFRCIIFWPCSSVSRICSAFLPIFLRVSMFQCTMTFFCFQPEEQHVLYDCSPSTLE